MGKEKYVSILPFWHSDLECIKRGQVTLTQWAVARGTGWIFEILYTEQPQSVEELRARLIKTMNELDKTGGAAGTGLSRYASLEHCKACLGALVAVGLAKKVD